ncbi:MAG: hypothetical protein ACU0CO_02085 [Shimia sp.]
MTEPKAHDAPPERLMTEPDALGRHWVHVGRARALAHPKGRPGLLLLAIAAWFAAIGAFEVSVGLRNGLWLEVALGTLTALTGLGLALRVPWAWVLGIVLPTRQIFGFMSLVGAGTDAPVIATVYGVVNAIVGVGVIFHLLEGDRPNLIYRHRFRSYRAERAVAEEEGG